MVDLATSSGSPVRSISLTRKSSACTHLQTRVIYNTTLVDAHIQTDRHLDTTNVGGHHITAHVYAHTAHVYAHIQTDRHLDTTNVGGHHITGSELHDAVSVCTRGQRARHKQRRMTCPAICADAGTVSPSGKTSHRPRQSPRRQERSKDKSHARV